MHIVAIGRCKPDVVGRTRRVHLRIDWIRWVSEVGACYDTVRALVGTRVLQ